MKNKVLLFLIFLLYSFSFFGQEKFLNFRDEIKKNEFTQVKKIKSEYISVSDAKCIAFYGAIMKSVGSTDYAEIKQLLRNKNKKLFYETRKIKTGCLLYQVNTDGTTTKLYFEIYNNAMDDKLNYGDTIECEVKIIKCFVDGDIENIYIITSMKKLGQH